MAFTHEVRTLEKVTITTTRRDMQGRAWNMLTGLAADAAPTGRGGGAVRLRCGSGAIAGMLQRRPYLGVIDG